MLSSLQSEVSGHKEVLQQIQTNVTSQSSVPESELKLEALLKTQEEFRQAQEEFKEAQEEFKEKVTLGILVDSFFAAVGIVVYLLAPKKHAEVDGSPIL